MIKPGLPLLNWMAGLRLTWRQQGHRSWCNNVGTLPITVYKFNFIPLVERSFLQLYSLALFCPTYAYPLVLTYTVNLSIFIPMFRHVIIPYPSLSLCSDIYWHPTHPYPYVLTYTFIPYSSLSLCHYIYWHPTYPCPCVLTYTCTLLIPIPKSNCINAFLSKSEQYDLLIFKFTVILSI